MKKDELIEKIIKLEWEAFDKVQNICGCRASCQDNWQTFLIMRKSQYLEWSIDMLESFLEDFITANAIGWNLITEKYARMMESTDPEQYEQLKQQLPIVTKKQKDIIETIVKIQLEWKEKLVKNYPKLSENGRVIYTSQDSVYDTSYETYLRGELLTYSPKTLALYGEFIITLAKNNDNLALKILENTVHLYGYKSLDEAEQKL